MSSVVKELHFTSQKLVEHLKKPFPKEDNKRDEFIEEIEQILKTRQSIIDKISSFQPSVEEKKLGLEIVKMNKVIEERLSFVQQKIKKDINIFKDKKLKNKKYDNPYDGPTLEGAFIDKRGV